MDIEAYKLELINFFYEYFAKSEVKIIQDAGHAVHIEKPKEFNRVIREFLKSLE